MSEEEESRVEVSFEKFERVVLSPSLIESNMTHTTLRGLARSIVSSPDWANLTEAYRIAGTKNHDDDDPEGDPAGRFMKLLNFISDFRTIDDRGYSPPNPLFYGRPEYTPESSHSSQSNDDATSESLSAGSFLKEIPHLPMGVRRTNDVPKCSWANCAIVLEVHDAYDQRRERKLDLNISQKRKQSEHSTDSSRASKRRRRTGSPLPSLSPPLSNARHSNAKSKPVSCRETGTPPSRCNSPPPPRVDTLITNCAKAVFHSSGIRRHVLGIHTSGWNVRLYMFDRAGVVYTEPLNISLPQEARAFVAAVLSLQHLSLFRLGLESFLTSLGRDNDSDIWRLSPAGSDISATSGLVVNVGGVNFITEDLIMSSWSMYGRGTTIFGVRLLSNPESRVDTSTEGHRFQATRIASRRRPNIKVPSHSKQPVLPIQHRPSGLLLPIPDGESLVMKLSWHHRSRQSEDELLRIAQEKGVEGVIRLYASCVANRLSDGFRGELVPKDMYLDRELRVQILGPRCVPLKHIAKLEDFKEGFRSLVRGHRDLYEKAGILHRDISLDNLMVDANDHKRGILVDLDIAARIWDGSTRLKPNLAYAGTLGFRSIDLLETNTHFPTRTMYRDDLESFFYVLHHILHFYRNGKRLPIHDVSGWWEYHDERIDSLSNLKLGLLSDPDTRHLPNSSLTACWLQPLRKLISKAYNVRGEHQLDQLDGSTESWTEEQEESMNGIFTFDAFMTVIMS